MDQQRGRSPSAGHQHHNLNHSHSPSRQPFQDNGSLGLGIGLDNQIQGNGQQFLNNNFNSNNAYANNDFMNQQTQAFSQGGLVEPSYVQSAGFPQQFKQEDQSSPYNPQLESYTQDLMNATSGFNEGADFPLYPPNPAEYDPSFFSNDPVPASRNQSVNPSQLDMSSPQNASTPPSNLLQPDSHSPGSAHNSPNFNTNQFQSSPNHSRHASLGPESAAFPFGQPQDWSNMMPPQFTGHRRAPSEYSDVSASSVHHSPNLGHHDSFDAVDPRHSPMQQAQDSLYEPVLGIGNFSLTDNHNQIQHSVSPGRGLSPAHSPAISPRLGPQQLPMMGQQNPLYMMNNNGFPNHIYGQTQQETFPQLQNDMNQSQQMVPDINVEFAPASRQNSFEPPKPTLDQDALTPPDRGTWIASVHTYITDKTRSTAQSVHGSK